MKQLETAMIEILEHGKLSRNPLIQSIIKSYQISKIGTGGMGFNWETGSWGTMPKWIVEAFYLLDGIIANHERNRQATQQDNGRHNPFDTNPSPNR